MTLQTTEMQLLSPDGSSAQLTSDSVLEIRDARLQLIFEYHPTARTSTLHLHPGVRLVVNENGAVELVSKRSIRFRSEGTIELEGVNGIKMRGRDVDLDAQTGRVAMRGPLLDVRVGETNYESDTIIARATDAKVSCGRLEQVTQRIFLIAHDIYQRIEGFMHTRAERMRTHATRSYLLQGEDVHLQARNDVRVQGQSINLG